jgi:hypothetical protein
MEGMAPGRIHETLLFAYLAPRGDSIQRLQFFSFHKFIVESPFRTRKGAYPFTDPEGMDSWFGWAACHGKDHRLERVSNP